jgi:hypothetical protein
MPGKKGKQLIEPGYCRPGAEENLKLPNLCSILLKLLVLNSNIKQKYSDGASLTDESSVLFSTFRTCHSHQCFRLLCSYKQKKGHLWVRPHYPN